MTARVDPAGTTIVTVVFEPELPLLELQATSMARFLEPSYPRRLIVLDNTARGIAAPAWRRLQRRYGPHADRAELVRGAELSGAVRAPGWYSQQVLKLAVSAIIDGPSYLTLDAKNHFVRQAGRSDFESADGRARGNFHGYETHPLLPKLKQVLEYEGLDPEQYISRFAATATPFMLYTDRVRSMIAEVERASGRAFADEFIAAGLTEYFLYAAWLARQGERLEELYDSSGVDCPSIWPRGANARGTREAVAAVRNRNPALMSVHRTALARMDRESVGILGDLWVERGLFDSVSAVRAFVLAYRARYFPLMAIKKMRDRRAAVSKIAG